MKIYFGEVDHIDIEDFGDEGSFEVLDDGITRWFHQGVEWGTNPGGIEEVTIFDGCNRSIPVYIESVPQLVEALNKCYNNYMQIQDGINVQTAAESDAVSIVEGNDYFEYEVKSLF